MDMKEDKRILLMLTYDKMSRILRALCWVLACLMMWLIMWFNGKNYILYLAISTVMYLNCMILSWKYERKVISIALEMLGEIKK